MDRHSDLVYVIAWDFLLILHVFGAGISMHLAPCGIPLEMATTCWREMFHHTPIFSFGLNLSNLRHYSHLYSSSIISLKISAVCFFHLPILL